jgi:nickel transport protein
VKTITYLTLVLMAMIFAASAQAHSINYQVEQKGMAVRAYYSEKDAAAYSQFELFGPGDKDPYQTGRTDKNGYIGFVPDRPGIWKLQVWGESTHGFHGVTTEIKVDQALALEGFKKPMVAAYTKFVTGISLIIGIFGIYAFWLSRRKESPTDPAKQ